MAFTTWTALATQIKNDIANGVYSRKSVKIGDQTIEYHDYTTAIKMLEYVEARSVDEQSVSTRPFGRTHTKISRN